MSSSWFCLRLRTDLTNQYVLLIQLFSYANETIYLLGNLPFFKIHVNCFMAQDDSPCVGVISKRMLWVKGLVPLWVSRHFLSLVSRLLVAKAFDCVDHNKLWKILKEMGIPDHLTWLLRNLYAGQEATVRNGHRTTDCSKSGKEYVKAIYCHPAYFIYMLGWIRHKLESRLLGEISITSDMQMTPHYGRKQRTKDPLSESERGEWKSRLKTQQSEN